MGTLAHLNINKVLEKYPCNVFIETGTGDGVSTEFMQQFSFEKIWTSEIMPQLANKAKDKFALDSRVTVFQDTSQKFLFTMLQQLEEKDRCFFWLDAHFPGADYGLAGYNDNLDSPYRLPMETELKIIRHFRKGKGDIILIDDLLLFETGEFEDKRDLSWIHRKLDEVDFQKVKDEYDVHRLYHDQGYMILFPISSQLSLNDIKL